MQLCIPRIGAIERFLSHLNRGPVMTRAPGLVLNDRSGDRIAEAIQPSNEWNCEKRAELEEGFASREGHV